MSDSSRSFLPLPAQFGEAGEDQNRRCPGSDYVGGEVSGFAKSMAVEPRDTIREQIAKKVFATWGPN